MPITPIRKNNVTVEVMEQIKNNIIRGEWKPGDKIPSENELKEMFGVSRNSVRTALQQFIALGILISKHGGGTFVSELSPSMYMNSLIPALLLHNDGLLEMLEFRKVIEVESVKLAALRATQAEIEELESIIERMKSMIEERYNTKSFAIEDSCFHEVLVRCAKNSVLMKVYTIIKELLLSNQVEVQKLIGPMLAFKFHPLILDAVKRKDPIAASKLMEEHIQVTIALASERVKENSPIKNPPPV
jgi:GntR family transcriptional regulator, transcriptional repressor for pyruvate dehydrogenase complex